MKPPVVQRTRLHARRHQRGIAALTVSVLLLFGMTLIAFFMNRGMLFEQKTAVNQQRATRAFETAEAGLDWATAMLNDSRPIDTACSPVVVPTPPPSFRKKFVPRNNFNAFSPVSNSKVACRIIGASDTSAGTLDCNCPAAGSAPTLTASDDPRFTVEFTVLPDDPNAFAITSAGCIGQGSVCGTGTFDAISTVRVTVKQRTSLPFVPMASLTVGRQADIGSAANAINLDPQANGVLINAGLGIGIKLKTATTIPGTPDQNALIANDAPLYALSTADSTGDIMFSKFFGMPIADYAAQRGTVTITGGAAEIATQYALGKTSFYVPGNLQIADLGTRDKPVILIVEGELKIQGTVSGLVYSNQADLTAKGWGGGSVVGATIVRGDLDVNASPSFTYDGAVLQELRDVISDLVRVPGSWRDF